MRAQNLTVSIPPGDMLCDKNCPYCVSRMTGYTETNIRLVFKNVPKVKTLAQNAQVTNVLLTGKGEPTLNRPDLMWLLREFRHYPIELQTNGINLSADFQYLEDLAENGLNVLAVSIDNIGQFTSLYELFARSKELGMLTRATVNITGWISKEMTFYDFIDLCRAGSVDQLMLRQIVVPNYVEADSATAKWINENVDPEQYDRLFNEMKDACTVRGRFLRQLHFGPGVYDYKGVSVSYSDYCIQDSNEGEDIRSLIFLEDGHLYTSWNSTASAIL